MRNNLVNNSSYNTNRVRQNLIKRKGLGAFRMGKRRRAVEKEKSNADGRWREIILYRLRINLGGVLGVIHLIRI